MADLKKEIENRRTFAIISHPDAGKTTITEKFLLYGGAIQEAGMAILPLRLPTKTRAVHHSKNEYMTHRHMHKDKTCT